MAPPAPNSLGDLKPTFNQIQARDGKLSLDTWVDLLAGNVSDLNNKDIPKIRSLGLTTQADVVQQFVNTHKFNPVAKTWGSLQDEINNAQGITGAVAPDIGGFLSALVNKNTWLRIGEGAMGIILLAIGVSVMIKSTSVGAAGIKAAKNAGKMVK